MSHRFRRAAAATCLAALGVAITALPASAHVTVSADDTSEGADDSVLTFRVPNEMNTAGVASVKLDVKFPTSTPLAEVDPEPMAGYSITTKAVTFTPPLVTDDGTIPTGVGEVTWTANSTATGIPVGDFQTFRVLVGPLPTTVDHLTFPAIQTYSNGKVISWVQPDTDGATNPAAVLALTAAASSATPSAAPASAGPTVAAAPELSKYASTSEANTAKTLGIIGIVVGALGLLAGAVGVSRSRRSRI